MELRWLDDELADVTEIYRCIAADDPGAEPLVVERIQAAVRLLAKVPHRGRPGRWSEKRGLVIPRTFDIVPYRVRGDVIEILRVFHSDRRWPDEPVESV